MGPITSHNDEYSLTPGIRVALSLHFEHNIKQKTLKLNMKKSMQLI